MKALLQRFMGVSGGHQVITRHQAEALQLDQQWQDPDLPTKQRVIVTKELATIRQTHQFPPHMQAIIDQMRSLQLTQPSVLEIGCSSGYYSEIFKLAGLDLRYQGCDYSAAFVNLAKELYPHYPFQVDDNTQLHYADRQFDVVVSGCCILHILNYPKAITETIRVAKQYVIFSRTPVIHLHPTVYTKKKGYGIDMVEIIFNESELFQLFRDNGLTVLASTTFGLGPKLPDIAESTFSKTYLCARSSTLSVA